MAENESTSNGHSEQPIIIKKIKKGGHGHHGGAWKVAYADFVTALMAFFIVMWILASSAEVKEAVADYFNNPDEYSPFTGVKKSPVDIDGVPVKGSGKGDGDAESQPEVKWSFESTDRAADTTKISEVMLEAIKDSVKAVENIESTGTEIKKEIEKMTDEATTVEMKNILTSIKIEITQEGMRIELLESYDNNFFEIGSARLKPEAVKVLKQLAERIGRLGNYVEIEGHTDSRGYINKTGYGNWELSSDRANSARKILETGGLWPGQIISVAGFADRKLRNPNNPFDYSNRRISILVKNLKIKDLISTN